MNKTVKRFAVDAVALALMCSGVWAICKFCEIVFTALGVN